MQLAASDKLLLPGGDRSPPVFFYVIDPSFPLDPHAAARGCACSVFDLELMLCYTAVSK